MFRYTKALCRKIPKAIVNDGLRMKQEKTPLNYEKAVESHEQYVKALQGLGIQVTLLEADEALPDCVFVEDTAVVIDDIVLITLPGAPSRQNEVQPIKEYFETNENKYIKIMKEPAHLDGGDVFFTGREVFVGLSSRTNQAGIETLQEAFHNYPVHSINVSGSLHLKSVLSLISEDIILCSISPEASKILKEVLQKAKYPYSILRVPEEHAANVVYVNDSIICRTPDQIPMSYIEYEKLSVKRIELNGEELHKVDGCFTCQSLLFK